MKIECEITCWACHSPDVVPGPGEHEFTCRACGAVSVLGPARLYPPAAITD